MRYKRPLVVISDAYWDDPYWASRHYIPQYLSQYYHVLYVEKAPTWISPFKYQVPWSKVLTLGKLRATENGPMIYSPRPRAPFDRRYRWVSHYNQWMLGMEINHLLDRCGFANPILMTFDHKADVLCRTIRTPALSCYYVVDEITGFNWPFASKQAVIQDERATIQSVDLVFGTSQPLLDKCQPYGRPTYFAPHGVELAGYNEPRERPADLREIRQPIAGFVGKIEEWVDLEFLTQVADRCPDVSFVIIGPANVDISSLTTKPNIHLLGPRKKEELPAYLQAFDCGIIVFKQNDLTHNVNPLKLYEYFAAGLPVISTPMHAILGFRDLGVVIENTPEQFAASLHYLLRQTDPSAKQARRDFAQSNSWAERAKAIKDVIEGHLSCES